MSDIMEAVVRAHADRLAAATEAMCWKAMAQGVGNRVWRSHGLAEPWPSTVVNYQFAILKPGDPVPGSGVVFGPFSKIKGAEK
jgi:hypothetical protein